jgi:hypothetical protein
VQAFHDFAGHRVDAVDDGGRAGVGVASLLLLLVGEGFGAQRKDLVDLGGVEKIPGAFRAHRRVVVEQDRR